MKTIPYKIEFIEDTLGTSSANPDIHKEFIASKSGDAEKMKEETSHIPAEELFEKTQTVFPKEDGKPFFWDYQVRGFFKDACSALRRVKGTKSSKVTAYKKIVDGLVFVNPRKIFIQIPEGQSLGYRQRPLRGQTAQGERIALASSESVPAGSRLEFEVVVLDEKLAPLVAEWMEYGKLKGLGQWRNSGAGRFEVIK